MEGIRLPGDRRGQHEWICWRRIVKRQLAERYPGNNGRGRGLWLHLECGHAVYRKQSVQPKGNRARCGGCASAVNAGTTRERLLERLPRTLNKRLAINQCTRHGFYSISIDDDIGGYRLTPSKCCGSWQTVYSWRMDRESAKQMIARLRRDFDL